MCVILNGILKCIVLFVDLILLTHRNPPPPSFSKRYILFKNIRTTHFIIKCMQFMFGDACKILLALFFFPYKIL